MIVYLHGFRSSPESNKARLLAGRMAQLGLADRFHCPHLPVSPRAAVALAERAAADAPGPVTVVGSSLGGYYATWLAERHGWHAVLVNPAVAAHLSLQEYVGTQTNLYSGQEFEFTAEHVAELRALDVSAISRPERYWLLVETGDELLDYRIALAKYAGARQTVIDGGDHCFQAWADYLDRIIEFAGLSPGQP